MSPVGVYFGITVALGLLVSSSTGFCCGYKTDGIFPGGCCSHGACNIFCCNCAGSGCYAECRSLNPDRSFSGDEGEIVALLDVTLGVFKTIDKNMDNFIDYKEALVFYRNMTGLGSGAVSTGTGSAEADFPDKFSQMDKDQNGMVERHEFDESLTA